MKLIYYYYVLHRKKSINKGDHEPGHEEGHYLVKKKSNIRHIIGILLVLFFLAAAAPGQKPQKPGLTFESISLEHGLSQYSIHSITQDKKGFMWFGTQDGLNKYDGSNFSVYRNIPTDLPSLSDSHIRYN
ncbi:MAG TPA: two-component regulator propeller domain-containing protein [Candidatus Kapabacteria bacterium]|nr:two-component regulator propeller domain-containing protein [Candidatus Kapabacteria bacterium]